MTLMANGVGLTVPIIGMQMSRAAKYPMPGHPIPFAIIAIQMKRATALLLIPLGMRRDTWKKESSWSSTKNSK